MPTETLTPNTILMGERLYEEALDLVIAQAQHSLQIFDQDFKTGNFSSMQRFTLLQQFLSQHHQSQLTIILHDSNYLTTQCPRLLSLLKTFGHKMTVYTTNDAAKIAKDCFIIADKLHYIKRIHIDQARFKYAFDDAETCANLEMRFNELLEETSDTITATQIGL